VTAWALERDRLIDLYGQPERMPRTGHTRQLLRALGVPDSVDPDMVFVCRYSCVESAAAFAVGNREHFGHTVFGPFVTESGVLSVVDYSAALLELRRECDRHNEGLEGP